MVSNFLGTPGVSQETSLIISTNELMTREGAILQKGMNFRDDDLLLSVFLILPRDGEYKDVWYPETETLVCEGHDSTTVESGKSLDQLMMYESGRVTENGKFYKEAQAYKDGVRKDPLQIQVYEKLDTGVWFDKGICNLMDAEHISENGRKVFKFHLTPVDADLPEAQRDSNFSERMIPVYIKEAVWKREKGRCSDCASEMELHFVIDGEDPKKASIHLRCGIHSGKVRRGFL